MSKRIKWGVIGAGGIARRRTIPEGLVAAENAELMSVYDVDAAVNAEVAKEFGAVAATDIDQLLGGAIDAVYVATPASLHCEHVLAGAKAGKHVLCEKPLGMTVSEATKMIAACQSAGVLLGTTLMLRFHSQVQAVAQMAQQGKLGKLTYGRAQMSCWYPPIEGAWRQARGTGGGGSLMDMGGHCIDIMEMIFGKISKVSCFINNTVHDYESEDSAVTMLFFENGAMATVDNFFCIPDNSSKFVLEVYGSKGGVIGKNIVNQGDQGQMVAFVEASDGDYDAQQEHQPPEGVAVSPPARNTYRGEIEEFSQAIIEKRQPANSAELGLRSQKVLAACYESAESGRAVEIAC